MVKKVVCDGCGNIRDEDITHPDWGMMTSVMTLQGRSHDLEQDLCQQCTKKVRDFIKSILTNQG